MLMEQEMKQIIAAWLNRYFANAEALVLLLLITLVAAGLYLLDLSQCLF